MYLIFLLNILFASTFTLGKAALAYVQPIFFVGIRMICAGLILLGYRYITSRNRHEIRVTTKDWALFVQVMLFQVYIAFVGEYWALQYITSAKTALLYSMAPFLTAIFSYRLFKERFSTRKIIGLCIGLCGFSLVTCIQEPGEQAASFVGYISSAELVLLFAIAAAAYGWLVMKQLLHKGYSFVVINGWSMLGGGIGAFITSLCVETYPFLATGQHGTHGIIGLENLVRYYVKNPVHVDITLFVIYTAALIIIANIIFYNLYGYLLHRYSATLLSFSGLMIPFITAFFGWFFLSEHISMLFIACAGIIFLGLYLFYQEELLS